MYRKEAMQIDHVRGRAPCTLTCCILSPARHDTPGSNREVADIVYAHNVDVVRQYSGLLQFDQRHVVQDRIGLIH